jgi:hypothetical protein
MWKLNHIYVRRSEMAQLTIYIDKETIQKIENAAIERKVSVSRFVRDTIQSALEDQWPASYSRLFGALADTDFGEPEELADGSDVPRESL